MFLIVSESTIFLCSNDQDVWEKTQLTGPNVDGSQTTMFSVNERQ